MDLPGMPLVRTIYDVERVLMSVGATVEARDEGCWYIRDPRGYAYLSAPNSTLLEATNEYVEFVLREQSRPPIQKGS